MRVLCCYSKRRCASPTMKSPEQCKRDVLSLTLARLDEFESLTPLMVVPDGNNEKSSSRHHRISTIISRSPPPPRRLTNGKTLIVPLNSGKGCIPLVPLLATPDNKDTSFKNFITKGCSTIAEDNENVPISLNLDKFDADFISIDRLPIPSYAPPPLPSVLVRSSHLNLQKQLPTVTETNNCIDINSDAKAKKSLSINSMNSLSSPQDSSFSTGSPLDTGASISDSFTGEGEMNSEEKEQFYLCETGLQQQIDMEIYGFSPELDYSISEPEPQHKYILHRIEEESEQYGDIERTGIVTSRTLDSIKSSYSFPTQVDSHCNIIIPHSISQQVKFQTLIGLF
ncbi:hypothetical protein X798_01726 [Onchocerca flexuosa]|uniref:Uncharacterized protein n=2 Tax=Onchocerca flexuosa TaxID=387005 RepID=A0A183HYA4_9BILA|nr:hypothetical protein X798_01726 [Onchocerca flexuosa]VDP11388.1 unnamed protein product [Onchocerca flexuosa]